MLDGELQLERVGKGRRSGSVAESSTRKLVLEQHARASNRNLKLNGAVSTLEQRRRLITGAVIHNVGGGLFYH